MSSASLLKEIEKLPAEQLGKIAKRVWVLTQQRRPSSAATEARLLERIRKGMPQQWDLEFRALIEKRRAHGLSEAEQSRVIQIVNDMESFNVRWLKWVGQLAQLRNVSATSLLKSLKLPKRPYV